MNINNNINGVGNVSRDQVFDVKGELFPYQVALVEMLVSGFLNCFHFPQIFASSQSLSKLVL